MRYLLVAGLCLIIGMWSLENYVTERNYESDCKDARRERLRKMNLGGQVVSEEELGI